METTVRETGIRPPAQASPPERVVAVVGNPNCGKTTLFNALTGLNQRVGNWPGVTVEKKSGRFRYEGQEYELIDLPGIYSLSSLSQDEEVARNYILSDEAGLYVNIVDASNPDRNLYLTSRLLEMGVPVVVALNMIDSAQERGISVDPARLSSLLGCPVIPMVASRGEGIGELKAAIAKGFTTGGASAPGSKVSFPVELDEAIRRVAESTGSHARKLGYDPAWLALKLLENDHKLEEGLDVAARLTLEKERDRAAEALGDDPDIVIADAHYRLVSNLSAAAITRKESTGKSLSDKIDSLVLNRFLGIPLFLGVMYLMFLFTINLGGAFIDFFDIAAGALFVDGFGLLLQTVGSPEWLTVLLASGVGGALQTMATFIPPIGFMFIFLSILEDSGYMARAAYVMDRGMRAVGLPGKAFIPLLVGFGCNVPAIMSARTMSDERDRIMTVMMTPFMSCGARMPVYALFAAAFFPTGGQNLVFLLYLMGIAVAIMTGFILKKTLLKGEPSPFIMEMPPYHLPTLRGVALRVGDRLGSFLVKAGKVLVPVIVVLGFMNSIGTDGSFGNEENENSVLAATGKALVPVFKPLGLREENWPAAVGLFTGIFAKEAVVGTLDNLYAAMDAKAAADEGGEEPFSLAASLGEAFATIPANLAGIAGSLLDPLGLSVGDVSDQAAVAGKQGVGASIFGSMVTLFDGTAGAFAYLVFILLYFPCVAAIAAVYRETNLAWTLFAGAWTTGLAYVFAVLSYQIGTWGAHPGASAAWIAAMLLVLAAAVTLMRLAGSGAFAKKGRA
ncbi:Fe(2+) transporter permease subunit FeoB [Chlorobaculum limnaeum]|uniref:Fe(2+) transporter permease subunit FeoB n=1 Tax=Chlorobaculum limnaeum TaxID=274537 RepID=UPI0009FC8AD9|nr:Fe(2+) transporter permease subunit FeoB [Chlorobaculum limnaeum]